MSRDRLREELSDIINATGSDELTDAAIIAKASELGKRLAQTCDAIDRDGHPATSSDVATMREVIAFLDRLATKNQPPSEAEAQESLRGRIKEWLRT